MENAYTRRDRGGKHKVVTKTSTDDLSSTDTDKYDNRYLKHIEEKK